MKWVRRVLGFTLGALWVAASFRMLMPAFQGGAAWTDFVRGIESSRFLILAAGVLTILAALGWLLASLTSGPKPRYLSYETNQGVISISLKALQDVIASIKGEFPAMLSLAPKVSARNEGLDIVLEVRLRDGAPVPDISRMLQERVRSLISERIGVAELHRVEVKIEEIVVEAKPDASVYPPVAHGGDGVV